MTSSQRWAAAKAAFREAFARYTEGIEAEAAAVQAECGQYMIPVEYRLDTVTEIRVCRSNGRWWYSAHFPPAANFLDSTEHWPGCARQWEALASRLTEAAGRYFVRRLLEESCE